ncbi:hypothetical protein CRYUN_Cryun35bG0080700 [Craigia yunnanensis]
MASLAGFSLPPNATSTYFSKGKEGLLISERTKVIDALLLKRCPHCSEIQSIVLTEIESTGYLVLGSVDVYGHLIVSKLDASGKDVERITYSVLPQDFGVGEGSWSGLCFSQIQWSMGMVSERTLDFVHFLCLVKATRVLNFTLTSMNLEATAAVAQIFCKSVDVYDQDIHLGTLHTLWYPSSLNFMQNLGHENETSILAVTEGCQISGLAFSSLDSNYICVQGVEYEVFCGQWLESSKVFSFRGDSNWLGFSKLSKRDILCGWCDLVASLWLTVVGKGE